MSNNPLESALGIKNFRQEFSGIVQSLVTIPPINPATESLTNPATFNTRFNQMAQALKHCYNAMGDIAIRDKRYLETFLTGYANPLITQSFQYANPLTYSNLVAFNTDGTPLTFPEERIAYSLTNSGQLSTTATQPWVFKNGVMLDKSNYTLANTAYGVKCFIKATTIAANDKIDIVVNRIYNTISDNCVARIPSTKTALNNSFLIPITAFGIFYHTEYLKVYIKRAGRVFPIPRVNIIFDIDVTGNTVKLDIRNYPVTNTDEIWVANTVFTHVLETTVVANVGMTQSAWDAKRDITLSAIIGGVASPVPYMQSSDFDVFWNGYKLIPDVHYGVIDNYTPEGYPILRLLFTPSSTHAVNNSLRIYKNDVTILSDTSAVFEPVIGNCHGLFIREETGKYLPFMSSLGHCFAAGMYIPNSKLYVKHKNILKLDDSVGITKDFVYQTRILKTIDIGQVIDHVKTNLSEFDQVVDWIGKENIIQQVKDHAGNVCPPESPENLSFVERFPANVFDLTMSDIDSGNLSNILVTRYSSDGLILDTNVGVTSSTELGEYFAKGLLLNTNDTTITESTINTNNLLP